MRKINFPTAVAQASNPVAMNVSANFVAELSNAFRVFPPKATMRFKQDFCGRLVIAITVTYDNGKVQSIEGFGDADLIPAIILAMGRDLRVLGEYKPEEHQVEVAVDGEDLVAEILHQYLNQTTQCYIEKDWVSPKGERYRKVTFTPAYNKNIKFCLKATDEINNMIAEACKPEWMKQAEQNQEEHAA